MRPSLLLCILSVVGAAHERIHDAAHSLQSPFVAADGNKWELGAGAKVEGDFVRLTPDQPSRTGYLWSRLVSTMADWEVTLEFKISGNPNAGGEGMAFWYVEKRMLGPVFGSADYWNGLGIFFDTYNNDGQGQSPLVAAIYNDGTQPYANHNDGVRQALANCHVPRLRNPAGRSYARITYLNKVLSVQLATDSQGVPSAFRPCFNIPLQLGVDKFFGVTAHTGQLMVATPDNPHGAVSDAHDVFSITTFNLAPLTSPEDLTRVRNEYREEIENKHKQVPQHHEVSDNEFKHAVVGLLGQIEGALQVLDQSQLNIQSMMQNSQIADETRDAQRAQLDSQTKQVVSQHARDITSLLQSVIDLQNQMQPLISGVVQTATSLGAGAAVVSTWTSEYSKMLDELKTLRIALEKSGQGNVRVTRENLGDRVTAEFAQFKKQHEKYSNSVLESIEAVKTSAERLQQLTKDSQTSTGIGWFSYLLLFVLLGEVVALLVLQFWKPKGGGFRSKFM